MKTDNFIYMLCNIVDALSIGRNEILQNQASRVQ